MVRGWRFIHGLKLNASVSVAVVMLSMGLGIGVLSRFWPSLFKKVRSHDGSVSRRSKTYVPFIATDEWQPVFPYHICPCGLQYKMDFQTGMNMARKKAAY